MIVVLSLTIIILSLAVVLYYLNQWYKDYKLMKDIDDRIDHLSLKDMTYEEWLFELKCIEADIRYLESKGKSLD